MLFIPDTSEQAGEAENSTWKKKKKKNKWKVLLSETYLKIKFPHQIFILHLLIKAEEVFFGFI